MCNEFINLCKERYSVRSFANIKVEDEKIEYLIMPKELKPKTAKNQIFLLFRK